VSPRSDSHMVDVEGRQLKVNNLTKVLYPRTGFTKGQVIDYYARIAPALLPHVVDRAATFLRFPDGIEESGFFAKHAPAHRPAWVRAEGVASTSSGKTIEYVVVDDLPTLIWAAQSAAIEIHVPQWRIADQAHHDLLVIDLDPGAPATILDCVRVAESARELLAGHGMELFAKTSGKKGLHLYAPLAGVTAADARELGRTVAAALESRHPDLALSSMAKANRVGKVFVDWSQNTHAKTTVAPYSLRASAEPAVSTPVTWGQLAKAKKPADLWFSPERALQQVAEHGDLLADL
jgi:bifunctional non-homologous end joining protein LigD